MIVVFLLIASTPLLVGADEAYWMEVSVRPTYIVVGTLSQVAHYAFEMPNGEFDGYQTVLLYDTGSIIVERILYGEAVPERIPIAWQSDHRIDPPRPDGIIIYSQFEKHAEGERRIWILWRQYGKSTKLAKYLTFQDLDIQKMEQVQNEIKEMENR